MACTDCDDGALGLRAVGDVNECSRESVAVYHVPRTAKKLTESLRAFWGLLKRDGLLLHKSEE